jgi:glycyl-tRNA synthetase alpha chain
LAAFQDAKDNIYKLEWGNKVSYEELRAEEEKQFSIYNFEMANVDFLRTIFSQYQGEAKHLLEKDLYLPAFDYVLKCSHTFNILDARKAISIAERNTFMTAMRTLAAEIAGIYIRHTEEDEAENE